MAYRDHVLGGQAETLPQRYYTSEEVYRQEQERIFSERWVCVGRAERLSGPGDYVLPQLAGESLIVVRDRGGDVRAFYNVCRHRGTRLCTGEGGRFPEAIQCPYHAWTYGLDGRLIGAPQMTEEEWFDKADYPLHPAALQAWEGWLFLNLADPAPPLAEALAPLDGKFSAWRPAGLRLARRIEYQVAANWKLLFENFSECYHCPRIHPELSRLSPYRSGRNDLHEGPILGGFMDCPGGSLTLSGQACAKPLGDVSGEDLGRAYYYSVFPNLFLTFLPDYVMATTLWPEAVDRTRVACEWLFDPEALASGGANPEDAVEFWDRTNRQDWHVCELAHQGVSSRAYTPGPYSSRESLLPAFDREYLKALEVRPPA